jgi:hypothetical protein
VYGYNGQFDLGDENANNNLFWTLNGEIVYAKSPAFPLAPAQSAVPPRAATTLKRLLCTHQTPPAVGLIVEIGCRYYIAGVCVVMNTVDKRQRFFTCHSDNVVSLALHKKYTRASGSTGAWQPSRAAVSD